MVYARLVEGFLWTRLPESRAVAASSKASRLRQAKSDDDPYISGKTCGERSMGECDGRIVRSWQNKRAQQESL